MITPPPTPESLAPPCKLSYFTVPNYMLYSQNILIFMF